MLGVLTGIGGLLAALQGLHTLLFGLPLFWGLFGMCVTLPTLSGCILVNLIFLNLFVQVQSL